MRVHVTGADGFLGRHLMRELYLSGHSVMGTGSDAALVPQAALSANPGLVIHAGAVVGRERCTKDKRHALAMNVTSTMLLAEACAETNTSLLLVSSAEVYGNARGPLHESHLLGQPRNTYALTKRWAEDACRLLLPSELVSIARLGMQYGPGARLGADTLTNFMGAAERGEELCVYRDARRSWTYIGDTARALVLIAEECLRWREHGRHTSEPAVFNVESGEEHTLREVAEGVLELTGGSLYEVTAPHGYSDIPRLETERLRSLGWKPEVTLAEGMRLTYEWLHEREQVAA